MWKSRSEQVELQCLNVKTSVLEEPINLSFELDSILRLSSTGLYMKAICRPKSPSPHEMVIGGFWLTVPVICCEAQQLSVYM